MSTSERIHLGPGVPDVRALGVEPARLFDADDAIADCGDFGHHGRYANGAEILERSERFLRLRYPLPGTPDETGRFAQPPRGAGTGWVVLQVWSGAPLRELFAARFTHPRSASLAEREWNVICRLRACGVGTPEPLAVGRRGEGLFARRSFLVTRELEGYVSLPRWLERGLGSDERRSGLDALHRFLARLKASKVELPDLSPDNVFVSLSEQAEALEKGDCAVRLLRQEFEDVAVQRMQRRKLPSVAVVGFRGARIERGPVSADRLSSLESLLGDAALPL